MASAVIGSLRVDLSMNSAQFQKGAKQAQSTLGSLGGTIKAFAAGAIAALSFGAITRAITSVVNKADELGKTAQKIGIPVEALSRLEYAGKLADVSLGQLSIGVGKLAKNMADIAGGADNDAAKALDRIGVSAVTATGALRPAEDVLLDIATKFAGMKDGAEKTALAMTIFGKSGRDLIPLLNEGASGIKAMGDEAVRFGVVISTETAQQAESFNDNLTRLGEAAGGLTTKITAALLPAMVRLTDAFVDFVSRNANGLDSFLAEAGRVFETTRREIDAISLAFQKAGIYATAFYENIRLIASGDFVGGNTVWAKAADDIARANAEAARLAAFAGQVVNGSGKGSLPQGVGADTGGGGGGGGGTGLKAVGDATKVITEEMKQSAYETRNLNQQVLKLSEVVPEAAAATEGLGSAFSDVFAGTISSALSDAIDGTFKLKDAVKDLVNSLANSAIQNLFSSLSGGTAGTAGGGLFAGLGKLFGFAKGGTIFPGGAGGIDSQLVAFRKSPNERVDITKPGQRLERGSGERGTTYIDARGADPGQIQLLREELRSMNSGLSRRIVNTVSARKNLDPRFAT